MSILNELMQEALSQLELVGDEIDAWWVKALAETGNDDLQYIRTRQMNTELRSSTPEEHQLMRAEHQLSELEKKALPLLKKALPTMFAIEQQQARIAKIKKTLERQKSELDEKPKEPMKPEFLRFIKLLKKLGVDHGKVLQLRGPELVIFADLIGWKAKDPLVANRANPWREIYSTYQNRSIKFGEPGSRSKTMSEPGAPPPPPTNPEVFWGDRTGSSARSLQNSQNVAERSFRWHVTSRHRPAQPLVTSRCCILSHPQSRLTPPPRL